MHTAYSASSRLALHNYSWNQMSLSLNWKALSSRIEPGTDKKSKVTKPAKKRKFKTKDVPKKVAPSEPKPSASSKLLTPLEHALWTCSSYSGFSVNPKQKPTLVNYSDAKKIAPGKFVAIDCEFVGVGAGDDSALARVSIVNYFGVVLLDTFVKPEGRVTNWRTWVSGVTPQHMHDAISFKEAKEKVKAIISNRIVVGHAVHNDLRCLQIPVVPNLIRDSSKFPEFRKENAGKIPSLKKLCSLYLGLEIQSGQHSSVEDAQATMAIFRLHQKAMEGHFAR